MKLLILLCLLTRPFTLVNHAHADIEVMVWKDSKLIHHHTMRHNDRLKIVDIGSGILFQFTWNDNCRIYPFNCPHIKSFDNGWYELTIDAKHLSEEESWWRPNLVGFRITPKNCPPKNTIRA